MRYLPLSDADRSTMLQTIGAATIDDLFRDVPAGALLAEPVDLPAHASELSVERQLSALARRNVSDVLRLCDIYGLPLRLSLRTCARRASCR